MATIREISGNSAGDYTTIFQGDFSGTFNTGLLNEDRHFLEKISKTDPFYDRKRILDLKGPFLHESFEWILNHDGFQKWRNTKESGTLWIKGDPGKGKTMLLCGIIDDLEKNPGINSNFCYFFCQATDNRINTAVAVIGGLIFSLLEQRQQLLSDTRKMFQNKMSQLSGPNAWQILSDIFEAITQGQALQNVVCVIDALDECEHDVKLLLSFITKTSRQIKWLISSRNVKEIEHGLRLIDDSRRLVLELKGNAECVSHSVDAYIDDSIRDITALTDDEELRIKTVSTLKFKADGTFLWVSLVVEQLRDTDRRNIGEVLEELPVGLENLYDLIMQRITKKTRKKDKNVCQIVLSIVTTAERPLRLEELLEFIKFQWKDYNEKYDVRDMKDIVKDCGSFLSIKDDIVYLFHQSVKDYMVGKGAETIFPSGIKHQHSEMFKNSLSAMSYTLTYDIYNIKAPGAEKRKITKPYPDPLAPVAYCCVFCLEHLYQSYQPEKPDFDQFLEDSRILHRFLKEKFLCWLESLALLDALVQGAKVLEKLQSIVASRCEYEGGQYHSGEMMDPHEKRSDNSLRVFIDNALQFICNCEEYVSEYPLQLYYAAFVFGDNNNLINKESQQISRFGGLPKCMNMIPQFYLSHTIEPKEPFELLSYSPDSSLIGVLENDHKISLWRADSGDLERQIELYANEDEDEMQSDPGSGRKCNIAFSSDSSQIVSVSSKGVVQIWSIKDQKQMQRYHLKFAHRAEKVIALSQNGTLAASVLAGDIEQLNIWATETGNQVQTIRLAYPSNLISAVFSPNSELLALADEAGVAIYSIKTGGYIRHLQQPHPRRAYQKGYPRYKRQSKFSPNSEILAYVHDSRNMELWCTKTWKKMRQITLELFSDGLHIIQFGFSSDSETFIIGTDNTLLFGSVATGQFQQNIYLGMESIAYIFSPDWNGTNSSWLLATGLTDDINMAFTWRVGTAKVLTEAHNVIFSKSIVDVSPDSKLVAAVRLQDCDIDIIAVENGEVVQVFKRGNSKHCKPSFSTNSDLFACQVGDEDDINIWNVNTGKVIQVLLGPGYDCATGVAFSYDSKYLVACYNDTEFDGHIKVWCVESGKNLYKFDYEFSPNVIVMVAISLNSEFVALGDSNKVQIWEPRTGHCAHNFGEHEEYYVQEVAFSSDSRFLAVIGKDYNSNQHLITRAQIREVITGACLFCVEAEDIWGFNNLLFDPVKGDILTNRFIYQNSSWENWESLPRHVYSLWDGDYGCWIYMNGEKIVYIPQEFTPSKEGHTVFSGSLLAYTSITNHVVIIKLPGCHGLREQETKIPESKKIAAILI